MDSDRYRFATRLNSFRDRGGERGAATVDVLRAVARVPGLTAVELNYPQHLHGTTEAELTEVLAGTGLVLTALSLRFEGQDFADGAFTSPRAETRARAIRLSQDAVEAAARLGVPHVNLWMAHDGFDYPFQVDYDRLWADEIDGFRQVAAHDPAIRVSVEYKPIDPRRTALVRGMGEALLAVRDVGLPNFGVQIDFCHSLMAREQPALAASLALREDRLFGVHLNDGYGQADDGLLVGSVHPWQTLELLATLRRFDYHGTIYFDTFPVREDPAAESAANMARVRALEAVLDRLDASRLADLQARHDALGVQALLHEASYGWDER
ncbi:MAG: sugar phosphate isomerase/epimerase [Chloroflexia bacterium]|nr:sugar phosphate isomerase/epimerase [Chloroflexia bacterium]